MARIYRYHPETGAYLSEYDAKVREDGSPILPETGHQSLTGVPAPEPQKGYMRVFDRAAQSWRYEENHHKHTVYDKETGVAVVLKIGKTSYPKYGPIPEGYTAKKPPSRHVKFDRRVGDWVEDETLKAQEQRRVSAEEGAFRRIAAAKSDAEITAADVALALGLRKPS
ncbi:hypothetical protein [Methyloceanibacter caenitepidi]|uniref:Uncharacterized protein n=1 Tax=Methyloceanibacter caenitepidi TaxID=1384459 RepID=A0A0A8K705_9HYPH|nr:hypothetical protein [Methyloceanibacter caenitepidi]BAQ18292.1 hypothetical protein GL4_2859 [Methyloceanibacter caenitepidi]